MKIRYCSDLHLEFQENRNYLKRYPLKSEDAILLLAGDITLLKIMNQHIDFFNYCSDNFQMTYWIPGNHEYYHYDLGDVKLPLFEKVRENVILLNNKVVNYHQVELIFSTLWSYIPPRDELTVQRGISDFHLIKNGGKILNPADFNLLHQTDFNFLESAIAKPTDKKRIVITHHVPTLMHYPEPYRHSNINSAFAVELFDFIEGSKVDYWIYGHHHCNVPPFKIGNTMMLTNQLGYVAREEHWGFDEEARVEV